MHILNRPFFDMAVIQAPLQEVMASFANASFMRVTPQACELVFPAQNKEASADEPPLLLWSPACAPGLTAFMPQVNAGDYFVIAYACTRFGFAGVQVRSSSLHASPINEFISYRDNALQRIVRVMRDTPRWDFFSEGAPLPIENTAQYQARRIRDRLNRDMLLTYLHAWGAPVLEKEFWRSADDAYTFVPK